MGQECYIPLRLTFHGITVTFCLIFFPVTFFPTTNIPFFVSQLISGEIALRSNTLKGIQNNNNAYFSTYKMDERKKRHAQYNRIWIAAKRSASFMNEDAQRSLLSDSDSDKFVLDSVQVVANVHINEPSSGSDSEQPTDRAGGGPVRDLIDAPVVNFSSDEERDENKDTCLAEDLVSWRFKHTIKHNATDDLLKLLKRNGLANVDSLPSSARTLLKTDRHVRTKEKSGMKCVYLGLEDSLKKNFNNYPQETKNKTDRIEISLNIDGLPLFRSSNTCL